MSIENAISYGVLQEDRLRDEISEYIVTEHIERQFRMLLDMILQSMTGNLSNETSVWVFGATGSGKSSFTKYLGLALDDECTVDGKPFSEFLRSRLQRNETKGLLDTVVQRSPAAVIMLDLATEEFSKKSKETISSILYSTVANWADCPRIFTDNAGDLHVPEMIDMIREKSGKRNVIFIIDNAGEYVAASDKLIIDLHDLAKNIRQMGCGGAWIICTAQENFPEGRQGAGQKVSLLNKVRDTFRLHVYLPG